MSVIDDRPKMPPIDPDNFSEEFRKRLDAQEANPEAFAFLNESVVGNPVTLGPRVTSPEDWAKKQTDRAVAASSDWLKNVKTPRRNPIEAALKADGKRKDRLAEAERLNKWSKKMAKVNIDEMYDTIDKVGAAGYSAGVSARVNKVTRVVKELQPMVAVLAGTIDAMPDATEADRIKRLLAARQGMIDIGKKRAGT